MKLRPRNKDKELSADFRFAPKTRIERVFDSLLSRHGGDFDVASADHRQLKRIRRAINGSE